MPLVTTQVEIAAPPAAVRAKFLDWTQIPTYAPGGFIVSIASSTGKAPIEVAPGDVLDVVVGGGSMKFSPAVVVNHLFLLLVNLAEADFINKENSPQKFSWLGSLPYIFNGEHRFHFKESKQGGKSTLFVQEEEFSGVLGWVMGESYLAGMMGQTEKTKKGFEGFNRDFKAWVERK